MYYIKNFSSDKSNLSSVYKWIAELNIPTSIISNLHLKLLVNEGYVNACNASRNKFERINIIITLKEDMLEILITDVGNGFKIDEFNGNFSDNMLGKTYKLFTHPLEELMANVIDKNCIRFFFNKTENELSELIEKHRGLLSMLKISDVVEYRYSENSLNYLYLQLNK